MRTRICAMATLSVLAIALSGCPRGPQVRPGDWIFTFYDQQGSPYYTGGLTLNLDGTTTPYYIGGNTVVAVTGWWLTEGVFTLEQKLGSVHILYNANVETPTVLRGESFSVPQSTGVGTFTAIYDDGTRLQQ